MEPSLISVVVITYNSAPYILETLISVRNQTYKRIELIVSDDDSQDETVGIVKDWINNNVTRFEKTQVIESERNRGITCNLNKGLRAANGQYVKPIAGDDVLLPNCLANMYEFCKSKGVDIAYSDIGIIDEYSRNVNRKDIEYSKSRMQKFFSFSSTNQYRWLLREYPIFSAGLFVSSDLLRELNYLDERYRFMEDYPFALKVSSRGIKLNYLGRVTVLYRTRTVSMIKFLASQRNTVHLREYYHFLKYDIHHALVEEDLWIGVLSNYFTKYEKLLLSCSQSRLTRIVAKIVGYLSLSRIVGKIGYFKFICHKSEE